MLDIQEQLNYDKVKEMLSLSINIPEDDFEELSLDELFKGNTYLIGIFLLNVSEVFSLKTPLDVFSIDIKNTFFKDVVEMASK